MTLGRRLVSLGLILKAVAPSAILAQRPAPPTPALSETRPVAPPPDSVPRIRDAIARQPTPPAIATLPRSLPIVLPFDRYTIIPSTTWSHESAGRTSAADAVFLQCTATLRIPRDTARSLLEGE